MSLQTLFSVSLILLIVNAGCEKKTGYKVETYKEIQIQDLPEDQKIPLEAWNLLQGINTHAGSDSHGKDDHGAPAGKAESAVKSAVLGEIKVFLVEKNPGVLNEPSIAITFPRGGGTIDLAELTTGQRGSFFVGFEFKGQDTATQKKVLFFSDARKRKIDGQIFGSGCRQYFDITDKFFVEMQAEGLKVNTTQDRHVSVLGGSFYFSIETGNELQVAKIRFFDSQRKRLFCQEN